MDQYQSLVTDGTLDPDEDQAAAMHELQLLHLMLTGYDPRPKGILRKRATPPQGLYMWGGVGRGKSLLMDLFFDAAPVAAKRRVHFHEFMAETHERIGQWRAMDNPTRKKQSFFVKKANIDDPVPHVARATFQNAHLLCFDEFQVTDIADAMLLGRFFEALFSFGVVAVATSNRHPTDLYKDGLNRQLFLPFIDQLQKKLQTYQLDAARDYRLDQLSGVPVYHFPLGPKADAALDKAWSRLISCAPEQGEILTVRGRQLPIERAARGAARVNFQTLCAEALGAEDYLSIARNYNTVFMDHIPQLSPEKRNEAKRFVTLIDALYEHKTKFVCSADAPPDTLYPYGDGAFEFERTVSRLIEMQSADYLGQEHGAEMINLASSPV